MTLRENIRRAIRESISTWSQELQPNLYALDTFLKKSGYRLVDVIDHEGESEIVIEPKIESHLYPDIIHDMDDNDFYIKTVDHGLLNSSDMELVIQGYTTALGVVDHLKDLDLSALEISREDEEQ